MCIFMEPGSIKIHQVSHTEYALDQLQFYLGFVMIDLAFYSYTYVKMYLLVIHLKMTIKHKKYVYP